MSVEISTQIIHASFAAVINKIQKNANIYDNPNQQGTVYPAWFIVHRSPVEVQKETGKRCNGNRYLITYQIDLWYMLQQNITRLFDQYTEIAELLEYNLQYLPIFGSDVVVQVYDRSWSLELNALKYSTTLKLRVYTDEKFVFTPMEVIEDLSIYLKNQRESIVTFTNTEHPEFNAIFPNSFSVTTGRKVNLPYVTGTFEDDYYKWTPSAWTLGYFGELIQVNENLTANLEWESSEKTVYPQGQFAFGEMQLDPEIFVRLNAVPIDSFSNELMSVSGVQISTSEFINDEGLSFVMSQNGLMESTGIQQSHGEFIDDAGLNFVMSQNELMETWEPSVLPTVTVDNTPYGLLGQYGATYINPRSSSAVLRQWDGSAFQGPTIVRDSSCAYAFWKYSDGNGWLNPCGKFIVNWYIDPWYPDLEQICAKNPNAAAQPFYSAKVATCDSSDATVVTVYNSSNEAFNAFKYTKDNVYYYYVLDGTQADWTDDLESIGYHLPVEPIDVFFYLISTADSVTFSANDYWGSFIIDNTDKDTLEAFGVTVEQIIILQNNENRIYNAVSKTNFDSFNFEPIGLYTGERTGETSADMTNFYCAEGYSSNATYGPQVCIWSRNAYNTSVKTWKCRITKKTT